MYSYIFFLFSRQNVEVRIYMIFFFVSYLKQDINISYIKTRTGHVSAILKRDQGTYVKTYIGKYVRMSRRDLGTSSLTPAN